MGPPRSIRLNPDDVETLARVIRLLKGKRPVSRSIPFRHNSQEKVDHYGTVA
jgi:hypothetical protein